MISFRILVAASALSAAAMLAASATSAHETPAAQPAATSSNTRIVRLNERQIAAGNFAIQQVTGGVLNKRVTVPGTIVPSGDRIAKVSVR
ncbi:hypothetical protein BH10PSE10_BH10PSE10_07330 [soil metagenome]